MDRNKSSGGSRSGKNKVGAPHHGSELYALGTKSSARDEKNKVISSVKTVSERKRESVTSLGTVSKKQKIASNTGLTTSRLSGEGTSGLSSNIEPWEFAVIECEPYEFLSLVLTEPHDSDTIIGYICGAVKLLSSARYKNDTIFVLSLIYLAKLRPTLFCNDLITSALISFLKRDSQQHAYKPRNNCTLHVLASNLLARGYSEKKNWPEIFLKIYIDDASNERIWVDNVDCSPFTTNICTAFGTKIPPKSMLQPESNILSQTGRENLGIDDDSTDNSIQTDNIRNSELMLDCPVQDRYTSSTNIVEKYVLDVVKEQLNRRQQQDCSTRNFLKFLSTTTGICEVRALAVPRLEIWIHNGKLMKLAQELLTYICFNVTGQSIRDHEVLANLVKMRLKTKPLINIYMLCLKEMINLQPDILYIVLKNVVQNELSNARNPNNMGMLANMFQTKPDQSARHLAEIYQEFLFQREDCLRTLRVFLRELIKMLRYDMNLVEFNKTFLSNRPNLIQQIQQSEFRDRIFITMADLACLCMFLTVSPQVREANVSLRAGRDMRNSSVLISFYSQISQIQLDVLTWMHEVVPTLFKNANNDYHQILNKILLLDAPEQYSKCDQWPPEPERAVLLRLVSETPIHQDTMLRIILIGITKEIPFSVPDTLDVIEQVVKRASALKPIDYPAIEVNKLEIIDFLFSMAEYHHPENIQLPVGYEPPKLAISTLYWKSWGILLILSAHNPSTIGSFCWEQYPMLRCLMEMCITNQFHDFKIADEELQVASLERTQILEFESHLAAATSKVVINEQNSLLLSQLMLMDPMGVQRRPPNQVLDQLQQLNITHKLGHLLCRSRKPDLLLDIIQRHGTTQSMPWLADLVQNSDGDFNHLPVQCLCEFLLSNSANINIENSRDAELLEYLRKLLQNESCEKQITFEVLEYFLRRLASTTKQSRTLAINGLKLLLETYKNETEDEILSSDWLLKYLPQIPHFLHCRALIIVQLRAACQTENNPEFVMAYIQFIANHTLCDAVPDMLDHVMDMSQLIVERNTLFQQIIPTYSLSSTTLNEQLDDYRLQTLNCLFVMFNNYIIKLREHKNTYEWNEYPDLLMVHFEDGAQLPIHLNIIHAFVILLTHSSINLPNSIPVLDYWFPQGRQIPQAFTIDTNESVQLLPDWLKLKMIRSPVDRLVEVAMYDLTPDQIVLFVQNFGTPISSMSKLLALLDHAVIEQFDSVKNSILNKAYLAQLIEIQQARGAKNGHITMQALDLHAHTQTTPEYPKKETFVVLEPVNLDQFQTILPLERSFNNKNTKDIEEIIELVLKAPIISKHNNIQFRKLIIQLVNEDRETMKKCELNDLNSSISVKVLMHLMRIAESQHGLYYFQNIFQKSKVCTLFRALFSNLPDNTDARNFMTQVIDKIIEIMSNSPTINNNILLQILVNKRKLLIKNTQDKTTLCKIENKDLLQTLLSAQITELENQGRKFVEEFIDSNRTASLVEVIISILNCANLDINPNNNNNAMITFDKKGILIDWLAEVDSEILKVNKNLQIDLLFNSNKQEFRFYMLSLLCHQANWATLFDSVEQLLSIFKPNYDSTVVLNFIDALIQNPKMWQGRDKNTPKHEKPEFILNLNMNQAKVFIEYILKESSNHIENIKEINTCEILNSRIILLFKIIDLNVFNLLKLTEFIKNYNNCTEELKLQLLQQIYLMEPPIKFIDDDLLDVYNISAPNTKGCKADKVINYIIMTIANLHTQKDCLILSSDAELLIRKLAASHSSLFLRQLPVLASLLQGKAHMQLNLLRAEYHLSRFHQVLGVFELLKPLIFLDTYKGELQVALDCYFTLLENHIRAKEVNAIMFRFIEFLQAYINSNPSSAMIFIEQYTDLLQDLERRYRSYTPLHQLVQGLSLLKHKERTLILNEDDTKISDIETDDQNLQNIEIDDIPIGTGISEVDSRGAASFAVGLPRQFQTGTHFNALVNTIKHSNAEDIILPSLQEIKYKYKRSGFLNDIYDRLLELIFSPSTQIRENAYCLLIRHLKHNPGNRDINKSAVNAYIKCLCDSDSMLANSALENLIEITICLQEYAPEILKTAFNLGIQSRLNSVSQIKKCIQTLKLQHAC